MMKLPAPSQGLCFAGADECVRPWARLEAGGSGTRVAVVERHAQPALGVELRG